MTQLVVFETAARLPRPLQCRGGHRSPGRHLGAELRAPDPSAATLEAPGIVLGKDLLLLKGAYFLELRSIIFRSNFCVFDMIYDVYIDPIYRL